MSAFVSSYVLWEGSGVFTGETLTLWSLTNALLFRETFCGTVKSSIVRMHVMPTRILVFTDDLTTAAGWRCGLVSFR